MELKKIKYFLHIAEKGGLSKAASSLYLTQPTLSRFLANLEEELDVKLFVREHDNSLTLTNAGQIYLEMAKKIDALQKEAEAQLDVYRTSATNTILLGVDADGLLPFAGACADAVNLQYPHVLVEVLRKDSMEIHRMVKNRTLDLGFTAYEETDNSLEYLPIRHCPLDLIVGHHNPLAKLSYQRPGQEDVTISIRDLDSKTTFALLREGTILRRLEDSILLQLDHKPRIARTYLQQCTGVELVASSTNMVSFCPRGNYSDQVAYLALDPVGYYTKGLCYAKNKPLSPAHHYLIQLLRKLPETLDIYS